MSTVYNNAALQPLGEPATTVTPLGEVEAKHLHAQVTRAASGVANAQDKLFDLLVQARDGRIAVTLGYKSWTAYVADVASVAVRDTDKRRQLVATLHAEGMSQRAIASVVGASQKTVDRDLDAIGTGESSDPPAEVTGLDGKSYKQPATPKREIIDAEVVDDPTSTMSGPTLATEFQDGVWNLINAISELTDLTQDPRWKRGVKHLAGKHLNDVQTEHNKLQTVVDALME